jgi:hypothetical protein
MPPEPLTGADSLQIIDPVLTNVAVKFEPRGFVYPQLVNAFPVGYNIGQYPIFEKGDFFASSDGRPIPDDATTPIVDFRYSEGFYHCEDYRKRVRLTRKDYQQANPAIRLETTKIQGLLGVFAGEREIRLAQKLRYTGNGGQLANRIKLAASGNKWDEGTNQTKGEEVTIQKNVQEAKKTVYTKTGKWPNTIVLTKLVAEAMAIDFTLKDQLKYTLGLRQIAEGADVLPETLFGLKVVLIDGAMTNSAAAGAEPNLEEIWGKSVRILYVNPSPGWGDPTVAYGFRGKVAEGFSYSTPAVAQGGGVSQDEPNAQEQYTVVDRWSEPDPPANNIRVWECVDEKIVAAELGCEIENVIS